MYGVIDIGSNSVRLMLWDGLGEPKKYIKVTRLADGLCGDSLLKDEAIERTARAVSIFKSQAELRGVKGVYAFATAAVRRAKNGKAFTDKVKSLCGLDIDVVSGETEAELGITGVLGGADGGVIDIGGASTEIIVVKGGKTVFSRSLDIGTVRLFDGCGNDRESAEKVISEKIKEYGDVPKTTFYAIGGTATSLSAICQRLDPYDPSKVHGYRLGLDEIKNLVDRLYSMTVEDRKKLKGLQPERAEVISGGALLMQKILEFLCVGQVVTSERDNLEGYLIKKGV